MLTKNVHILRDFFGVVLLIGSLLFSSKAIDSWNESQQEQSYDSISDYDEESGGS